MEQKREGKISYQAQPKIEVELMVVVLAAFATAALGFLVYFFALA